MAAKTPPEVISDFTQSLAMRRLYEICKDQVARTWGAGVALRLGPVLYRALVAEELLKLIAAQDESMDAERIRGLVNGLWDRLAADQALWT